MGNIPATPIPGQPVPDGASNLDDLTAQVAGAMANGTPPPPPPAAQAEPAPAPVEPPSAEPPAVTEPAPTEPVPPSGEPQQAEGQQPPGTETAPPPEQAGAEDDADWKPSWEKEAAPEGTAPAEAQPDDGEKMAELKTLLEQDGIDPDRVIGAYQATNRGKTIYGGYKFARDLEKTPAEGGVGFRPTVEQVKTFMNSHLGWEDMAQDFNSGDPDKTAKALSHWFGKDEQGNIQPGAEIAVRQLPQVLAKSDPSLFHAARDPFLFSYMENLYRTAGQEQDQERRNWMNTTARGMEFFLTGKWRDVPAEGAAAAPAAATQGTQDPRLLQELQRTRQENEALKGQQQTSFQQGLDEELATMVDVGAEEALTDLKEVYPDVAYKALVNSFAQQVEEALEQDPMFQRELGSLVNKANETFSIQDRQRVIDRYRQQAGAVLKRHRLPFRQALKSSSADRLAQSQARHEKLQAAQARTAPAGTGGPPANPTAGPPIEPQPGESQVDYIQRMIQAGVSQ